MTTAREIMTAGATYCPQDTTAADAAGRMAAEAIGAVPVCDTDGRLTGVVTDRDLAVRVVAEGRDPASTRLADLLDGGEVVTVGADDSVEEAILSRRLPRAARHEDAPRPSGRQLHRGGRLPPPRGPAVDTHPLPPGLTEPDLPAGRHPTHRRLDRGYHGPGHASYLEQPAYAHLDTMIGRNAATEVFPAIVAHLDATNVG